MHLEFFPSRLYFSVVALCGLSKLINNNNKCDLSALNDMIGCEESSVQWFNIYSCRLEWIKMARWEQEIYPKEKC
jgi:hypothetical protein